uniref:hypothetical protein n=1 Tax=Actinomadura roseirufa TaxID=2094049 RepID=UPI001A955C67
MTHHDGGPRARETTGARAPLADLGDRALRASLRARLGALGVPGLSGRPAHDDILRTLAGALLSGLPPVPPDGAGAAAVEPAVRTAAELLDRGRRRYGGPDGPALRAALGRDTFLYGAVLALGAAAGGPPADLDRAVAALRHAVELLPDGDGLVPAAAWALGCALDEQHARHGDLRDDGAARLFLDRAPGLLRRADGAGVPGEAFLGGGLVGLVETVTARRDRDAGALAGAAARLHEALDPCPAVHPWRPRLVGGLGAAYLARGLLDGDRVAFSLGLAYCVRAADAVGAGGPARPGVRA